MYIFLGSMLVILIIFGMHRLLLKRVTRSIVKDVNTRLNIKK